MRRRMMMVVVGLMGTFFLAGHAAASTSAAGWKVLPSPNVGSLSNGLADVSALSSSDGWAVGTTQSDSGSDFRTLAEHWDGRAWSVVPSPNAGRLDQLNGVIEIASNDAWMVGSHYNDAAQAYQTLIEHWDGSTWSIVPSPNGGSRYDSLHAIDAVSPTDIWAVGLTQTSGSTIRNLTLVEHFDGTSWTIVLSPNRPGETNAQLLGVTAISSTDVWAAGFDHSGTLAEHWNGSSWSILPTPNPSQAFGEFTSITAGGPSDVWAVGDSRIAGSPSRTLAEHYDGGSWAIVPSPNLGVQNNSLQGVTAVSSTNVWAVGYFVKQLPLGTANRTLTEQWNGSSWTIVPSPNPGTEDVLLGAAAVGTSGVVAVGGATTQVQHTLVMAHS